MKNISKSDFEKFLRHKIRRSSQSFYYDGFASTETLENMPPIYLYSLSAHWEIQWVASDRSVREESKMRVR